MTTPAKKRSYAFMIQAMPIMLTPFAAPGILIRVMHPRRKRPQLKPVNGDAA